MKFMMRFGIAVHVFLYRISKGAIFGQIKDSGVLLLTTTGRKSGKSRTVPLVFMPDGESYVIMASSGGAPSHPGWYFNLTSNPQVTIQLKADQINVTAKTADAAERQRLVPTLGDMGDFLAGYQDKTSREIPLVILQPGGSI